MARRGKRQGIIIRRRIKHRKIPANDRRLVRPPIPQVRGQSHATFVQGDLATWSPQERTDLLFANAVFQWVPDHPAVLQRLLRALPESGVLAVQMPDNTAEPALRLMSQVANKGPFAGHPGLYN